MKSHLKRLFMPNTWKILRKETTYITRPLPGMHSLKEGLSINTFLKEVIGYAHTTKDVKNMLNKKEVLVDKKKRKEKKFIVGLMDLIEFAETKEVFRIILDTKGKIISLKVPENESNLKLCKIKGKCLVKGKTQLNLHDGRNLLTDKKDFNCGDSVLIELPKQTIKEYFKLEAGNLVYFTAGKKIGQTAKIKELKKEKIICELNGSKFETKKDYAFVIGKDKSAIKLTE